MTLCFATCLRRELNRSAGFTRVELLAVLLAIAVLAILAFPILAATPANSHRAQCFNNLRQVGHAVRQWSGDRFEEPPWLTSVTNGGTRPDTGMRAGAAWTEYLSLSNELVTPRILACPGDAMVKVASEWSVGPHALVNAGFRQQAISYVLGLHANYIRPRAVIAADLNMDFDPGSVGCGPAAVNNASSITLTVGIPSSARVKWTNGPHSSAGHLLLVDGSVTFVDSENLREVLSGFNSTETGSHHMLRAR